MKIDEILLEVRSASLKAALCMTEIANRANLDAPQRIMMLTSTFVAVFYSLRDDFTSDIADAVLQKLKYDISKLDEVDEAIKKSEYSNLDIEGLMRDLRDMKGDKEMN